MNETTQTVQNPEKNREYLGNIHAQDRRFVSMKESIIWIAKKSIENFDLGKYGSGSDIYNYQIFVIPPMLMARANVIFGIYDTLNDPINALIIDRTRTRWGKFKPFMVIALVPSIIIGLLSCLLPYIAMKGEYDYSQKIAFMMLLKFLSETLGTFFGTPGSEAVFTPNPNERTRLLTTAKFVAELYTTIPEVIGGLVIDLHTNNVFMFNIVTAYVIMNTVCYILRTIPNAAWTIVYKERVVQSEKPPKIRASVRSVFNNQPLITYTVSQMLETLNISRSKSLYFKNVLNLASLGTIVGIPAGPVSYYSYYLVGKFRKRFSTKGLWFIQRLGPTLPWVAAFLFGAAGRKKGWYMNRIIMSIVFALTEMVAMVFFALKKIIPQEMEYELLDYCEWKNGFRVEATIGVVRGYMTKILGYIMSYVNAIVLDRSGFKIGTNEVQTEKVKFALFCLCIGAPQIPSLLGCIPMIFYKLTKEQRTQMYDDLAVRRSEVAAKYKASVDAENAENIDSSEDK